MSQSNKPKSLLSLKKLEPRWAGRTAIVAASGPGLTAEIAARCQQYAAAGGPVIAVNDAITVLPSATMLYAADARWWAFHPEFRHPSALELWSTHDDVWNNKHEVVQYLPNINLVAGMTKVGFSKNPALVHYGDNSGFQALNIALLQGATKIILVGFNMQRVKDKGHFFGDHPNPFVNTADYGYTRFIQAFDAAKDSVPAGVDIVNCTPNTALTCFRQSTLEVELQ